MVNNQTIGTITLGPGQSTIQVGYSTALGHDLDLDLGQAESAPRQLVNILGNAGGVLPWAPAVTD